MISPPTTLPPGSWILITGANGFIASHTALQFLQLGYRVRGTVRSLTKGSWLLVHPLFGPYADNGFFELVVVPDMVAPGAFDEVVKGMSAVAHIATVATWNAEYSLLNSLTELEY
jgi:nucleoside-diphosphate-sugar epimerase